MADELNRMNAARSAAPKVENPKLGMMPEEPLRPKAIKGRVLLMAEKPKADTGKTKRMSAFRKAKAVRASARRPDQKKPPAATGRAAAKTAKQPEGYVRLRMRVHNGDMTVVGAKAVEGPLVESKLQGDLAYEVTVGQKRVAVGAIPDAGEKRSFPHPTSRKAELRGHHVTPLDTYEVNVRVPKEEVSAAALPRLEVALYRVKKELPVEAATAAVAGPIGPQYEHELREVGRLKGVKPDQLPARVAKQVEQAFK